MNGDGKQDLVVASGNNVVNASNVSVLLNRGNGRFAAAVAYRTGSGGASSIAVGDVNGDGEPDVATTSLDDDTVLVSINRGDGRLTPGVLYMTAKNPWDVAIGDLNGDGSVDLATANTNGPFGGSASSVSVFINKGNGSFDDRVDYRTGRRPVSVAIGDLNGDGNPDLATANLSDSLSVLVNRGDGTFGTKVDYRAGSGPQSLAIGDLNGDRKPDLVTANANTTPAGGSLDSVSVLLNRGDGTFRPKFDYYGAAKRGLPSRLSFGSVALAELNGDAREDVVIGNDARTVSVFVNLGAGRLGPRIDYRTGASENGWGPRSVATGTLNGDARADLVSVKSGSASVLLNTTRR